MRVLGVITARGGSKGLARKNLRPLAGKPLIVYTVEAALGLRARLHRLVVSTDDEEIAEIGRASGAEAPFLRPPELARDDTPSLPVVQHATRFVEEQDGQPIDWVLLLQPTSPLRTTQDLEAALDLASEGASSAVISVFEANDSHPLKMKLVTDGILSSYDPAWREGMRRQDFAPPVYKTNGAVYLVRRDVLMEGGSLWGSAPRALIMPEERSLDIDSELDFAMAELLMDRARA